MQATVPLLSGLGQSPFQLPYSTNTQPGFSSVGLSTVGLSSFSLPTQSNLPLLQPLSGTPNISALQGPQNIGGVLQGRNLASTNLPSLSLLSGSGTDLSGSGFELTALPSQISNLSATLNLLEGLKNKNENNLLNRLKLQVERQNTIPSGAASKNDSTGKRSITDAVKIYTEAKRIRPDVKEERVVSDTRKSHLSKLEDVKKCQFVTCSKKAQSRKPFCKLHAQVKLVHTQNKVPHSSSKTYTTTPIPSESLKLCRRQNCNKLAHDASGCCKRHGIGRRCRSPECVKSARGKTGFCVSHGGGKRCTFPECSKSAAGSTPFCIAHGGGKRCKAQECTKSALGKTNFCFAHGGGRKCMHEKCTKASRGSTKFCVQHGGGRRCQADGCRKGAQGATHFCVKHGGRKSKKRTK